MRQKGTELGSIFEETVAQNERDFVEMTGIDPKTGNIIEEKNIDKHLKDIRDENNNPFKLKSFGIKIRSLKAVLTLIDLQEIDNEIIARVNLKGHLIGNLYASILDDEIKRIEDYKSHIRGGGNPQDFDKAHNRYTLLKN